MSSVFDGGEGCINGGIEERSSDNGEWLPLRLDGSGGDGVGEAGGDMIADETVMSLKRG